MTLLLTHKVHRMEGGQVQSQGLEPSLCMSQSWKCQRIIFWLEWIYSFWWGSLKFRYFSTKRWADWRVTLLFHGGRKEFMTCFIIRKCPSESLKWPHSCLYDVKQLTNSFMPVKKLLKAGFLCVCGIASYWLVDSVFIFSPIFLPRLCWSY